MRPLSAVHLPAIRDALAKNIKRTRAELDAHIAQSSDDISEWLRLRVRLWDDGTALSRAGLWWVTRDMATLAWHTAEHSSNLPAWDAATATHRNGLMVFDGGLPLNVELPTARQVQVAAIAWHHTDTLNLTFFTADTSWLGDDRGPLGVPTPLVPIPHPVPDRALDELATRALTAAVLISAEPSVAQVRAASWTHDGPPKSRMREKQVPEVRVIALREILPGEDTTERAGPPADEDGCRYSHRWVVSDHTRTYYTGPGGSIPVKKWIAPYVAGPADLPLQVKTPVRVWRR